MKRTPAGFHTHGAHSAQQLSVATWPSFEKLFTSNNGVWGGCWCMFYHRTGNFDSLAYAKNKAQKSRLVRSGDAHGTIVYCGEDPVGWCQYGPKDELPRVDRKKGYEPTSPHAWRITCLFIDRHHRRMGFARLAVFESVRAMKKQRVRSVEAYPVEGNLSATFLWSGTPDIFEGTGFKRVGPLGKRSWIYSLDLRSIRTGTA